jgi:sugar lactone lactonase YvrE
MAGRSKPVCGVLYNLGRSQIMSIFRLSILGGLLVLAALAFSGCKVPEGGAPDAGNPSASDSPLTLTGTVSHLAGGLGFGNTNGSGTATKFNYPEGMAYANGYLYVADASNNQIRRVDVATQAVTLFAGDVNRASGFADGVGSNATFGTPRGIATDGTNLYVADDTNHLIRKIVIADQSVTTFAGVQGSSTVANGTGTAATFRRTYAIACDGTNLYVLDSQQCELRKIVLATAVVSTVTLTGPASLVTGVAFLATPIALTTDGTDVYVVGVGVGGEKSVMKVTVANGAVSLVAGSGGLGTAVDGVGANAALYGAYGVVYQGGALYVNDYYHVRKIDLATSAVTTIAGGGTGANLTTLATDGAASNAQFLGLLGITTDGTSLYLSDTDDNNGWESAIRRLQ